MSLLQKYYHFSLHMFCPMQETSSWYIMKKCYKGNHYMIYNYAYLHIILNSQNDKYVSIFSVTKNKI